MTEQEESRVQEIASLQAKAEEALATLRRYKAELRAREIASLQEKTKKALTTPRRKTHKGSLPG